MVTLFVSVVMSMVSAQAAEGASSAPASAPVPAPAICARADGYRGFWYKPDTPDGQDYPGGGMATYSVHHVPVAIYSEKAKKTFFVYGGSVAQESPSDRNRTLQIMISYFDHKTGMVPRPRIVFEKKGVTPDDNAALMLDGQGYVWVFVAGRDKSDLGCILRSGRPYDIDSFSLVGRSEFARPQPWYIEGKGFLLLHTRYKDTVPQLAASTSPDGVVWSDPQLLAAIEKGCEQVSFRFKEKVGMAFSCYPAQAEPAGPNNVYYMETTDFGKTWTTIQKKKLGLPLTSLTNDAIVENYLDARRLVFLKDVNCDQRGNPILMYILSKGTRTGPDSGRRLWTTARAGTKGWETTALIQADSNYDDGFLDVEKDLTFNMMVPSMPKPGPQPFAAGGEVVFWSSRDQGRSWQKTPVSDDSKLNNNGVRRPVDAHPHFFALWSDGDPGKPSECRLYYTDKSSLAYRFPQKMTEEFEKPQAIKR